MGEEDKPYQSRPEADVRADIMDSRIPKSDGGWWAYHKITELEATVVQAYELGVEHGEEAEMLRNIPCNTNILCTNEEILAALEKGNGR